MGGWGAVLLYGQARREMSGFEESTTNNRMELMAAIKALEALREPCEVHLHSDSAYLVQAFLQSWVDNWQRNGWKKADKTPVENQDLWQRLLQAATPHIIHWVKVKGHSDNALNNQCDALAKGEIQRRQKAGEAQELQ